MNIIKHQNTTPLNVYNNNNNNNYSQPNKSLSALFRTFTQSNLTQALQFPVEEHITSPDNLGIPLENNAKGSFNFDIGNIEYSPSNRDLADAQLHHILSDAMFQPVKRVIY